MSTIGVLVSVVLPTAIVVGILIAGRRKEDSESFSLVTVDISSMKMTGNAVEDFANYATKFFQNDAKLKEFVVINDALVHYMEDVIYPKLASSYAYQTKRGTGLISVQSLAVKVMEKLANLGIEPFASSMRSW